MNQINENKKSQELSPHSDFVLAPDLVEPARAMLELNGPPVLTSNLRSVLQAGFENQGFEKISAQLTNPDWARELRKVGFALEGILENHSSVEGKLRDVFCLGLTKKNWNNLQKVCREDIFVGARVTKTFSLSKNEIENFSNLSGDKNPIHLDPEAARKLGFPNVISHGILVGSLFSNILGTQLPGPGSVYLSQKLEFKRPVFPDQKILVSVEVLSKVGRFVVLLTQVHDQEGLLLLDGEAEVLISK